MTKHPRSKDFSNNIITSSSKNEQLNKEKQKQKKTTTKKIYKKSSHRHSITSGKNEPLAWESIIGQEEK